MKSIILNRPDVKNAADRPTAEMLARALEEFDADDHAYIAVFFHLCVLKLTKDFES